MRYNILLNLNSVMPYNTNMGDIERTEEIRTLLKNKELELKAKNNSRWKAALVRYAKSIPDISSFINMNLEPAEAVYLLYYDKTLPLCTCGKPLFFYNWEYRTSCGDKACVDLARNTAYKKNTFGPGITHHTQLESFKKKAKEQYKAKTGYEHPWQNPEVRKQNAMICKAKTGYEHALQNPESSAKRKNSCIKRHGTLNFLHCEKAKRTNIDTYGFENPAKSPDIIKKIREVQQDAKLKIAIEKLKKFSIDIIRYINDTYYYELKCNVCNNEFRAAGTSVNSKLRADVSPCIFCNPSSKEYTSIKEQELVEFIRSNTDHPIIQNCRTVVSKYELDVYIPALNVAIEFNGVYWHSELYVEPDYHIKKTQSALVKRIRIYHVWEDDWDLKRNIVKSMMLNILGRSKRIHARKCVVKKISNSTSKRFCDENHMQGGFNSRLSYGLFHDDVLVSVMCFSKLRFSKGQSWELTRFCSLLETSIIGGASKLFNAFMLDVKPASVISYCDISISPDNMMSVYNKLGFKLVSQTPPNPAWVIDGVRKNRLGFIKSKLIKQGFDKNQTAVEIMLKRGYYRVFDCGSWKFERTN